jgi:signal transduction histidine kinase
MTDRGLADLQVLEDTIAKLRVAVVALSALAWQSSASPSLFLLLWFGALAYAAGVLLAEPHRHLPVHVWQAALSLIDWGLISAAVFATGGGGSELYVLYFLFIVSMALRTGPRTVAIAGLITAMLYIAMGGITAQGVSPALPSIALRAAYIACVALGSSFVAAEIARQKRARSSAEAGQNAVQDITAAVSHDLLNPLSTIFGLVEMLQDDPNEPLSRTQQQTLARLTSNARRMTGLVRNLLDSEALERGTPSLVLRSVDVNALIERCADANACDADARKIDVEIELDPQLRRGLVDELLLERLINNLLGNALKFTPTGGRIRLTTRAGGKAFRIEVWNSGAEVPPELRPVIFEKHTRSAGSSGVGLGLYICKLAARLHGGDIALHHPPGGGVAFVVDLPLRAAEAAVDRDVTEPTLHDRRQTAAA